jgi:hypothetical protein
VPRPFDQAWPFDANASVYIGGISNWELNSSGYRTTGFESWLNLLAVVQVKYLGEEGDSTPVGAAAAVCSPWDLLVGLTSFLLLFLTEKDLFIPAQTLYSTLT